jgi:hypothetical protein
MCALFLRSGLLRLVFVITLGIILPLTLSAAEPARFKLTGYRAFMQTLMRYDVTTGTSAGGTSQVTSPKTQRELGVSTDSYVYHPNFLQMTISGSLLFDQRRFEDDNVTEEDSGISWNLTSQLDFLRKKPYPFSVFFRREHPLVFVGRAESFNRKDTSFGLNASLLQPFSPIDVTVALYRDMQTGETLNFQQDDTSDSFSTTLSDSFFGKDQTSLSYTLIRNVSESGDPRLPIQSTEFIQHNLNLTNDWILGDRGQFRLRNRANNTSTDNPDRQNFDFRSNLFWNQTENMRSNYDYKFIMRTVKRETSEDLKTFTNLGNARLHLTLNDNLSGSVGVRGQLNDSDTFNAQNYGAFTTANYQRPTPAGILNVSGAVHYDFTTQEAATPAEDVFEEALILPGTGFNNRVPLRNDFVVAGSVVVTNAVPPFTPCTEGVEYELHVVGTETLIQMLDATAGCFALTGSPLGDDEAPEAILVDYSFETGGTFDFSTLSSNINTNLAIMRYYNLFARFTDSRQTEHDSTLTLTQSRPLISSTTTEVGANANVPLRWNIGVGGEARYRHLEEDILSVDQTTLYAWVRVPLPFRSNGNFAVNRSMTDISDSPEDSDLIRYSADITSRPWGRLFLTSHASYEEDTGASIKTSRTDANIRAGWQFRKLRLSAEARYLSNTRGDVERERLESWLLIRRDIW